ncbi:MAG: UvrD-helicase domain-containing protein [Crocinitomicaceae bacterium]
MKNKLIIACAGSGKTTHLVRKAHSIDDENVLITTFTEANRDGIESKFIEEFGSVPSNVTIQTLVSFLLEHGVRPYQGAMDDCLFDVSIGYHLVEGVSGNYKGADGKTYSYGEKSNFIKYYFSTKNGLKIYSDKLSKFVVKVNEKMDGEVIKRITSIYPNIFVDEVQDLASWDLDLIKLLLSSKSNIILVGDPRQGTYATNNASKSKKYRKSQIVHFFEDVKKIKAELEIDKSSLITNHRSCEQICRFSNKLYPTWLQSKSGRKEKFQTDGVFVVREKDIDHYLAQIKSCMQLRDRINKKVRDGLPVMTFGKSKGLAFENVLIYPTMPIIGWLKNNNSDLAPTSRSKFYVALTRARSSVGIVYNFKDNEQLIGIEKYYPNSLW